MNVADLTGLPAGVPERLREEGIEELYPPQAAAVEAGILEGTSAVAAVPTASGKTLIAELAMLSAIERGGTALYIVPLRALASEKRAEFARWEEFGVEIGVSTGNYDADGEWLASRDLIVATSEKVDSLVRNDAGWLDELGCVVADEVHLVDDAHRGPTLEVTLAKLRRLNPDLQTIALSATVGNADVIADWLDAALIESDWRPIELRTGVHYGNAINFTDGSQREVSVERGQRAEAALVADALDHEEDGVGGSSLVFVNSRRNAESAARRLTEVVESRLTGQERKQLDELADEIRGVSDAAAGDDLADAVAAGAAFHHAGLTSEHRSLVEEAFRDRLLKVVCATPTLAAGVNTPARRVIVRDWRRYDSEFGGMKPLNTLEIHQMMGRAGRPGLDPYGEAVLLADDADTMDELFDRYLWADPEPVNSKLAAEPALRMHVLATVASGFANSREELLSFLDRTLYATQRDDNHLASVTDGVIEYLRTNGFLEVGSDDFGSADDSGTEVDSGDDTTLSATAIGHTVSQLYLDPMSAAMIIDGLESVGDDAEIAALGLYHLISRTPDMYQLYLKSGDREAYTELCYEREPELLGTTPSEFEDVRFEEWLSALKTARLLEDWADEVDEDRITDRYGVGPGDIRGKVETAEWLLGAAERLASELDLTATPAIRTARRRIEDGVREELLELTGVREIGRKRARRLFEAGIETRSGLRTAEKATVLGALRGRAGTAEQILSNAGREDPSMDGVETEASQPGAQGSDDSVSADGTNGRRETKEDDESEQSQASLGDFGV